MITLVHYPGNDHSISRMGYISDMALFLTRFTDAFALKANATEAFTSNIQ